MQKRKRRLCNDTSKPRDQPWREDYRRDIGMLRWDHHAGSIQGSVREDSYNGYFNVWESADGELKGRTIPGALGQPEPTLCQRCMSFATG